MSDTGLSHYSLCTTSVIQTFKLATWFLQTTHCLVMMIKYHLIFNLPCVTQFCSDLGTERGTERERDRERDRERVKSKCPSPFNGGGINIIKLLMDRLGLTSPVLLFERTECLICGIAHKIDSNRQVALIFNSHKISNWTSNGDMRRSRNP